ncbi:TetR family transcriptional regulator [Gordonia sp. 852002-50816_SCH5313054-c]|uniref:hypothetical protein n=1 Tax=unclassified Gordonia (in: high G+C Gram-positive bacteria) TaxID=2657482 RepID=UPI0007EA075F|nr:MULTISPECIES: hypothetical protein [unclassified Gordonia (in: high G+C Gram-positive bacteria)]OBC16973.1 TetR family transcriptional regulator [Gordonia sp. 852002-50816_SCH5313054-a]OBC19551.1 TetR family transcriptional regulator [Gordonia sp. 852002-50816_SCH5313054-c]
MVVSAKGTRLNKRGIETRRQVIDAAIDALAAARGGDPVSANLVARQAGVTWGTMQHQFGDVDGLWAAVLDHIVDVWQPAPDPLDATMPAPERIEIMVERFWRALAAREGRAVENLRQMLPGDPSALESSYPATAAAMAAWEQRWAAAYARFFDGLDVDATKSQRVQSFLPGALRGLWSESNLTTYTDVEAGRRGLVEAIVAYLC